MLVGVCGDYGSMFGCWVTMGGFGFECCVGYLSLLTCLLIQCLVC